MSYRRLISTALLAMIMVWLTSCAGTVVPPGSLQEQAAAAAARAEVDRRTADEALVAEKQAAAALELARQRSAAADQAATASPTPELIEAAARARIDLARAEERQSGAKALADGLEQVATRAEAAATAKANDARQEREAEAAAADLRQWVWICRLIGLGATIAGAVVGFVIARVSSMREGVIIGGAIAAVGQLVVAYGETVTWLPIAAAWLIGLGIAAWFLISEKTLKVSKALSGTVDALEGKAGHTIEEAKRALSKALGKTGLPALTKARAGWKVVSQDDRPTDIMPAIEPKAAAP